jgi:hypothetical protein
MLKDDIEWLLSVIKSKETQMSFNLKLFEIMEGNLIKYIDDALKNQLSANAYKIARQRIVPINILRRIVSKLSKLYSSSPQRKTELETDQELVNLYSQKGVLDRHYGNHNFNYNSYKYSALEFFVEDEILKVRAIPATQFIVASNNKVNPLTVTHYIKFMGKMSKEKDGKSKIVEKYWAYTDDEFLAFDSDGEIVPGDTDLVEGVNTFGVIPMNYVSGSDNILIPLQDDDLVQMAVNIPVKLTDLNFAQQFQSHGIIWVKNADNTNLQVSPNTIWELSSRDPDKNVEVGTLQPQVQVQDVLDLCRFEISAWLESKDIRPGTVGQAGQDGSLSGLSLLIQNADISENRKTQEQVFKSSENDFWKRLATIHNSLVNSGAIKERRTFSSDDIEVSVEFDTHKPYESRMEKVTRLKEEVSAKFTSQLTAMKELHPDWDEDQIEDELELINGDVEIDMTETEKETPEEMPSKDVVANDMEENDDSGQSST